MPVIAFKVGGNHELITSGFNGFLVEPFNLNELQTRIEELINNYELRVEMSLAAAHRAKDFSWGVNIDRLLYVYEDQN